MSDSNEDEHPREATKYRHEHSHESTNSIKQEESLKNKSKEDITNNKNNTLNEPKLIKSKENVTNKKIIHLSNQNKKRQNVIKK